MHVPPQLRGPVWVRFVVLVGGLLVFASGIVALLESDLGLSPWDVLHQGLADQTPLSFGAANVVVSIVVLGLAWTVGARIGIGTVANAVLVGLFVQLLTSSEAIAELSNSDLSARISLLAAGIALMGFGTGLYIGAGLGAGPRDSLMVAGAARTRIRIGAVRSAIEAAALAVGFALGGTVGVGTIAFVILIGPAVEASFRLLARSPLVEREATQTVLGPPARLPDGSG